MKSAIWLNKISLSLYLATAIVCHYNIPGEAKGAPAKSGVNPMTLYAKRDYKGACQGFYARTRANPYDAESFYYLGNCFVALRNYPQALDSYKKASDIAGTNAIGASSRTAIGSLEKVMHPDGKGRSILNRTVPKKPDAATTNEDGDVIVKKDPRLSAADSAYQAKITEGDKAAQKILDEATARCKPIKQDEDRAVQEVSDNQQARMNNPDSAKEILSDVKNPFEEQIKNIMEPAKRRAQELKDAAKREADRIKQSALSRH